MVRAHRWLAVSVAFAGAPFFMAACGGGGSSTGETTPGQDTTAWRTIPPVLGTDNSSVPPDGASITYIVKSGDYANKIAAKAGGGCTGQDLLDYNPELQEQLYPGATMKIPSSCLGDGVTEQTLNAGGGATDTTDNSDNTDSTDTTDSAPKYNSYTVVTGDYEFGIVKKTGCSSQELRKANPGKMTHLRPKMKLKIPVSCDTRSDNTDDTST